MTSDLLFSVLPREGKVSPVQDEYRVEQVSKEAQLKAVTDEDENLNAKERDARERQEKKKQAAKLAKNTSEDAEHTPEDKIEVGEDGKTIKHLDIYI
ncbi:hypothetical protein QX776_14515 [Alteromonadaceae bacterium BrNp21-10]|nr:hypothetical protein [Alteromonadaceae bacterium BrNp21-10]